MRTSSQQKLRARFRSRTSPRASTKFRAPHATQVGLDALPSELRPNTGKLRRLQAAQVSQHGPPQRAFALRPLMPEAEDRMLDVDLVLQACDLQSPADAQVLIACIPLAFVCLPCLGRYRPAMCCCACFSLISFITSGPFSTTSSTLT